MKTYIVSIVELNTEAPPLLQHLEVFKSTVYPEYALADESKVAHELDKRVEYIKDLVIGNVTIEMEEGEGQ